MQVKADVSIRGSTQALLPTKQRKYIINCNQIDFTLKEVSAIAALAIELSLLTFSQTSLIRLSRVQTIERIPPKKDRNYTKKLKIIKF